MELATETAKKVVTKGRGGKRVRTDVHVKSGAQHLLSLVVQKFGGPRSIAERAAKATGDKEFHIQNFVNWRIRGRVPFQYAFQLSKKLGIPAHALNYEAANSAIGVKSWRAVVNECKFLSKEEKQQVLSLKPPAGAK